MKKILSFFFLENYMEMNELEEKLRGKLVIKVIEQLELQMNEKYKIIGGAKLHGFYADWCAIPLIKLNAERHPEFYYTGGPPIVKDGILVLINKYGCTIPDVFGD